MIGSPDQQRPSSVSGGDSAAARGRTDGPELYAHLFRRSTEIPGPAPGGSPHVGRSSASIATTAVAAPARPQSLAETGLTLAHLADLTLKVVYLHGSLTGGEICAQIRLPFSVLEEVLAFLRQVRCLEVHSGEMLGQITYRFHLTDEGRVRARGV